MMGHEASGSGWRRRSTGCEQRRAARLVPEAPGCRPGSQEVMRADFEGRTGDVGGHNRRSGMPRRASGGGVQLRRAEGRRKDFRAGTACRCLLPAAILLALSGLAMAQGPIVNAPTGILNQYQSVRTTWLTTAAGYA